ncbi:40S ribosomal protein S26, partial [Cryomyces antarcticus]
SQTIQRFLGHTRKIEAYEVSPSVRSREGRRNRAPPPRVRYNKDGKKVNPQQAAKVAGAQA